MKHALSSIKRLARYIRPYRVTFYLVILFTILTVVLNAIMPYVTGLPTTEISKNVAEGMPINFDYILKYLIWLLVVGVGYCLATIFVWFYDD
jgi:ATP-binding cassette subfamily B multidrug efflux pump